MKTAIIFNSKHGTAEKVANLIAERVGKEHSDVINLKNQTIIDLSNYNTVILGGSVYVGTIQKSIFKFCEANQEELLNKKIALFICGMEPDLEKQELEIKNSFPAFAYERAIVKKFMGGEILLEKMNFFEKMAIKKVAKISQSESNINYKAIDEFIEKLNYEK